MEQVIQINGGHTLSGEVYVSGAKNSAVALIPATLMASSGEVTLKGLPDISDVKTLVSILEDLNIKTKLSNHTLTVDAEDAVNVPLADEKVELLRASYYMMGAMLGRFKKVIIGQPGGCHLGPRPIDQHIKGFEALGATVTNEHGALHIEAEELVGTKIFFDIVSVGATINVMLAATMAKGRTVLENVAREPEIIDVATLLNKMGANIRGAGTETIRIEGVEHLNGAAHTIIPDRIEAGSYISLAATIGDEVKVKNVIPEHLDALFSKLEEAGVELEIDDDDVIVRRPKAYKPIEIKTQVYPGFATDLQQPITPLLFLAEDTSKITETIYPARFRHIDELRRMNAHVENRGGSVFIHPSKLNGADVYASDLRAGFCLVVAGLMAEGTTRIHNVHHIMRGYSNIINKLQHLGAHIELIDRE
ncbi:UDP-N-acetylglucosamine 1-carboxyvinyltransferase [Nosocomiicoccus massiliensis]|uniref:UDP-N-acetylglucosamine 1-carboxyvinyltransferase n=1 Tax=Nosocomiicoccus massiliensis TaxID=1232430 RepID=UPI00040E0735|nr:UDP-N-acetylglucosamine 1-carboxyvinyltransferase [Nosocomiicoccus massiliensis]